MITFSLVKENLLESGKRLLKVIQYGTKTADVAAAFGDDSAPLKDMIAIYANTSENGDNIIIGYLNKNQISAAGEKRIFSLKSDGSLSFAIHLKNDGTCEIGSDTDNAVRFSKLEEGFNKLRDDFNSFVNTSYNVHSHANSGAAPPSSLGTSSTANITAAKIDEIKVP